MSCAAGQCVPVMAFRGWDTPYRPFRLRNQLGGATFVTLAGTATFFITQALFATTTPTLNSDWWNETAKYAIAIKADPISNPEVRGNLADAPQYDYWERRKHL